MLSGSIAKAGGSRDVGRSGEEDIRDVWGEEGGEHRGRTMTRLLEEVVREAGKLVGM